MFYFLFHNSLRVRALGMQKHILREVLETSCQVWDTFFQVAKISKKVFHG